MVECGEEPEIEDEELDEKGNGSEAKAVLCDKRNLEKIEGMELEAISWRLKDRMKTVSVAIVICLNIPVDPPDVVKLQPCARLEAFIDPLSMPPQKAIENIGNNLQKAYERWQPKARYKISPDPTVDEIKKLCTSLRRNAKEERVLFHYNGHGVPRPTDNGEIWVFNSNYTQYIPLSIYDLQQWMGTPSVYVYDCSNAGKIVKLFQSFTKQPLNGRCIHFAACQENQMLPMNPDLPADLFTSCLVSPVKMAIRYYHLQHKNKFLPDVTPELMEKLPGLVNDRRSMYGELNWIFTAITDTIAWNMLPKDQFQKLFREDLLVASLFRNFLLAERILLSYDCTPVSSPVIPSAVKHHMWGVWDLCLELALSQLPIVLSSSDPAATYIPSPFFEEQLTAFQMWLNLGSVRRAPPDQLPIILQVLLSQVYRPRALELLCSFLNFGPWAVSLVLEVGIFPYILKLLQSTAKDLRPLLTHLWAKILAVDPQCKDDLAREQKYFTNVLKDTTLSVEQRTNAAYVMCSLVSDCQEGSVVALQGNILSLCLELITDENPSLRQWVAICAARTWHLNPKARWEATRDNAPDKMIALMNDPVPEVRAAAVYSLGTFIKSLPVNDRSDQGRLINHKIAVSLKDRLKKEASPLMRQELIVALHYLILMYENPFRDIAKQYYKESEMMIAAVSPRPNRSHQDLKSLGASSTSKQSSKNSWNPPIGNPGTNSASNACETISLLSPVGMKRSGSTFSLSFGLSSLSHEHLYLKVWQSIVALENDPYPVISELAHEVTSYIKMKIGTHSSDVKCMSSSQEEADLKKEVSGTPISKNISILTEDGSPAVSKIANSNSHRRRSSYPRTSHTEEDDIFVSPCISTQFFEWSSNSFRTSWENFDDDKLTINDFLLSLENTPTRMKKKTEEKWTFGIQKLDEQKFIGRNIDPAEVVLFHPSDPLLLTADKTHVGIWDIACENRVSLFSNMNSPNARISSLAILNAGSSSQYVCVGSNDGVVKVWKDAFKPLSDPRFPISSPKMLNSSPAVPNSHIERDNPFLVTAFRAIEEICSSKRETKLLLSWEQESTTLVTGSNADSICLWDLQRECKVQDIQTKGMWTTALHSFAGKPWIAAGFSDGNMRLYDRRNSKPLVREWKDHSSTIITTQLFNTSATSAHIISGAESGEVRLCDLRRAGSVQVCQPGTNIYCMSCHPRAHLFAVGTHSQNVNVYHTSGSTVNSIRYYNGLMGQRIGAVNCLSFHPSQVLLAVGTKEGNLAVYGLTKR